VTGVVMAEAACVAPRPWPSFQPIFDSILCPMLLAPAIAQQYAVRLLYFQVSTAAILCCCDHNYLFVIWWHATHEN
jgi:hypothetical protein